MYTGVQTYRCAEMRYQRERKVWSDFFNSISVNFCGDRYVEMPLLKTEMDKKLAHIDNEVRQRLYYLFDYEGEAIISDKKFNHLMKIWSAFSANDINNDNELDTNEVKTLFWLFDGKKPTMEKIKRETEIMDEDKSGTIDRLEWLAYLCSSGPDGSGKGNKDYYDFELRELFEKADKNKTGHLNIVELITFLKMNLKSIMREVEDSDMWKIEPEFKKCAIDCFEMLSGRPPIGNTDSLTWVEVKNFKGECDERM